MFGDAFDVLDAETQVEAIEAELDAIFNEEVPATPISTESLQSASPTTSRMTSPIPTSQGSAVQSQMQIPTPTLDLDPTHSGTEFEK